MEAQSLVYTLVHPAQAPSLTIKTTNGQATHPKEVVIGSDVAIPEYHTRERALARRQRPASCLDSWKMHHRLVVGQPQAPCRSGLEISVELLEKVLAL